MLSDPLPAPIASLAEEGRATIGDIFEALATTQPAAPAIFVPGRTTLTFGDLDTQVRYVQRQLGNWDIQPGDVVAGVLLARPELAVALATLPASCTFAPLDPNLTAEAYADLLARMRASAVLLASDHEHALRTAARRLGLDEIGVVPQPDAAAGLFALELRRAGAAPAVRVPGSSPFAYILTSSGTTGRRKLVPTEHHLVYRYARAIYTWLECSPADVCAHISPLYFGQGLRNNLMVPLLGGRSVLVLPEADVDALLGSIERYRPTHLTASFAFFPAILRRAPDFADAVAQSRFRFMRSGSGRLDPTIADRMEQLFRAPMLNALSTTETGSVTHDPLPPRPRKRGSVGLPVLNEVALLDERGNVRQGAGTGELLVRGPTVFGGYLDDPDLTAASFAGEWYRTGDLGRIDEDGHVFVLGRIREIINRGGEKISPIEVDLAIESLPGVKEAAAFAVPHPTLGQEMVAAVVRDDAGAALDEPRVIDHVRARMGPRRVPRRVYFIDRLPRTDNGKLRRTSLSGLLAPDPIPSGPVPRSADAAPLTALEGALAGLWSSLLQVAEVGRDDDFFLLGGDSLRGAQLVAHLKALFGVDLPIQALFGEAGTVRGMARAIEAVRAGARQVEEPAGASQDSDTGAPRGPR